MRSPCHLSTTTYCLFEKALSKICLFLHLSFETFSLKIAESKILLSQWISLLYRRVQKIEQIKQGHCDRYQNNHTKKFNWMALVSCIGNGGNISQISLKCRKSLNLMKLLKSWQFIISLKTFGGLINYFKYSHMII